MILRLVHALKIVAPWLSPVTAHGYATELDRAAHHYHLPALLLVAIIDNESHFHPAVTSGEGLDESVGFGQVKLRSLQACRQDLLSQACQDRRAALMTPATGIWAAAAVLHAQRRVCGTKIERQLAGYQGYRHCKPGKLTHRVIRHFHDLERQTR